MTPKNDASAALLRLFNRPEWEHAQARLEQRLKQRLGLLATQTFTTPEDLLKVREYQTELKLMRQILADPVAWFTPEGE